eukprot:RCo055101
MSNYLTWIQKEGVYVGVCVWGGQSLDTARQSGSPAQREEKSLFLGETWEGSRRTLPVFLIVLDDVFFCAGQVIFLLGKNSAKVFSAILQRHGRGSMMTV